jgi:hypothetical protein
MNVRRMIEQDEKIMWMKEKSERVTAFCTIYFNHAVLSR